ncbi:glycine--tRNA ligase subunit beta [Gallaecimonas kandeliae]|uniref:glycine--tRNA ligase subunit beta n=1 Tax=Gallaecimonas kandeliae TaxID=3029055 RepID=UPI0026496CA4|nr:glycine--tRNA ligase subunit beta [Gallaecimonas kandeliae]WKE67528.1 glycine--tRNA ligase subunit beta [Gallaecimonas kandeliae]
MMAQNLLIEIGTEELPPKALRSLAEAFAANLDAELTQAELAFDAIQWHAAPRRLALTIKALAAQQPDKVVEKRGPAVQAAFDGEGNPTKGALGWAAGCGIDIKDADRMVTDKGEWLLHKALVKGQPVQQLVPAMVEGALKKLPIPKPMRWGSKRTQFIRPVHTITALYGEELIAGSVLDINIDRIVRGHRFMGEAEFSLAHADHYLEDLKAKGKVLADFEARKAQIKGAVEAKAKELGGKADLEDGLLEEVASLVEWPVVLVASFEEKFLTVPPEALVYTMKGDQKYFPVYGNDGKLLNKFIFVANVESKDPQQIISGNEKVVRPRLADAEFFFNTDRKQKLSDRLDSLSTVLFQKELGTLRDKVERISALAGFIAAELGANVSEAQRAGLLSKCDLMTQMVMEFTDTQGTMGMHYARLDGEPEAVAQALEDQYLPRFAGDALPSAPVSCALALADKLDTLVGIFGIGQAPKGDKDPFALRRAALGALRIIKENALKLDLTDLIREAKALLGTKVSNAKVEEDVLEFMLGRFKAWYQDEGFGGDVINAVLARRPTKPVDFDQRVKAVSAFRALDAAEALAAANKRVGNILSKVDGELPTEVVKERLVEAAEVALFAEVSRLEEELAPLFAAGDYTPALTALAALREPVDAFFDGVMVMAEDAALKQNRLAILNRLRGLFLQVADISVLQ